MQHNITIDNKIAVNKKSIEYIQRLKEADQPELFSLMCLIMHTEMSHICFQKSDGLFLVSRFWLGNLVKNKTIKKKLFTETTAYAMAVHCCREYRNLAKILPDLFEQYGH